MSNPSNLRPPLHRLLWVLVILFVLADQLSKAYFVWRMGTHSDPGFIQFCLHYFALWGPIDGPGSISQHYFPFKHYIPVWDPWIRFSLTTNSGAAWSILSGKSFALSFVSLAMVLLLYAVWHRYFQHKLSMTLALAAIIGGALGNFIDRFRVKEVVDFVATKIPYIGKLFPALGDPYDFPIFNVADSCAVCGTIALAAYLVLADIHTMRAKKAQPQPAAEGLTPYRQGLDVAPEALEQLKQQAAVARTTTTLGLTRHHALAEPVAAFDPLAPNAADNTYEVRRDGT